MLTERWRSPDSGRTVPAPVVVLIAAGMAVRPRVARAQPLQRHRITTLGQGSHASGAVTWEAFWQELRALGYDDRELALESRWADGHLERLTELATDLVRLAPEVIVAGSAAAALAAEQATSTIPIVVTAFNDPVGSGLVASFAHPGGTGEAFPPAGSTRRCGGSARSRVAISASAA